MNKRKKYSKEFKHDAVRLVTEQGYSIAEAARNLGLNYNMLGRWKKRVRGTGRRISWEWEADSGSIRTAPVEG